MYDCSLAAKVLSILVSKGDLIGRVNQQTASTSMDDVHIQAGLQHVV